MSIVGWPAAIISVLEFVDKASLSDSTLQITRLCRNLANRRFSPLTRKTPGMTSLRYAAKTSIIYIDGNQ